MLFTIELETEKLQGLSYKNISHEALTIFALKLLPVEIKYLPSLHWLAKSCSYSCLKNKNLGTGSLVAGLPLGDKELSGLEEAGETKHTYSHVGA